MRMRRETAQRGVDDALGKVVVEHTTEHEPEVDRSDEHLGGQVDVGIGTEIAARDAATHEPGDLIPARLHDGCAKGVTESGVAGDL